MVYYIFFISVGKIIFKTISVILFWECNLLSIYFYDLPLNS